MSVTKYDASQVGVWRVDIARVLIDYSAVDAATVNLVQTGAVTMADGTTQFLLLPPGAPAIAAVPAVMAEDGVTVVTPAVAAVPAIPIPANITFALNLENADVQIPLVDFVTGVPTGATTTLESVMLGILAVARAQQQLINP